MTTGCYLYTSAPAYTFATSRTQTYMHPPHTHTNGAFNMTYVNTLSSKNSIYLLLEYTWDVFQDRADVTAQMKSQYI